MINVPTNVTVPITFPTYNTLASGERYYLGDETGELPCKAVHVDGRVILTNPKGNVMADISKALFDALWDKNWINEDTYVTGE